jgi:hypothetical protein
VRPGLQGLSAFHIFWVILRVEDGRRAMT